jgi:hypothetical protein
MRPTTRRTLAGSMRHPHRVTRDLRRRQLPTVTSHAVPTRECQSDPPSLPRAVRCSRPRGQPLDRASPLDVLLHVRADARIRTADPFITREATVRVLLRDFAQPSGNRLSQAIGDTPVCRSRATLVRPREAARWSNYEVAARRDFSRRLTSATTRLPRLGRKWSLNGGAGAARCVGKRDSNPTPARARSHRTAPVARGLSYRCRMWARRP